MHVVHFGHGEEDCIPIKVKQGNAFKFLFFNAKNAARAAYYCVSGFSSLQ